MAAADDDIILWSSNNTTQNVCTVLFFLMYRDYHVKNTPIKKLIEQINGMYYFKKNFLRLGQFDVAFGAFACMFLIPSSDKDIAAFLDFSLDPQVTCA